MRFAWENMATCGDKNSGTLIPRIATFGYRNYTAKASKRTATCKQCRSDVNEGPSTTSKNNM
jgi:hypothetical protein